LIPDGAGRKTCAYSNYLNPSGPTGVHGRSLRAYVEGKYEPEREVFCEIDRRTFRAIGQEETTRVAVPGWEFGEVVGVRPRAGKLLLHMMAYRKFCPLWRKSLGRLDSHLGRHGNSQRRRVSPHPSAHHSRPQGSFTSTFQSPAARAFQHTAALATMRQTAALRNEWIRRVEHQQVSLLVRNDNDEARISALLPNEDRRGPGFCHRGDSHECETYSATHLKSESAVEVAPNSPGCRDRQNNQSHPQRGTSSQAPEGEGKPASSRSSMVQYGPVLHALRSGRKFDKIPCTTRFSVPGHPWRRKGWC